jgi:uncharacterized protein (TIRG00374 family)
VTSKKLLLLIFLAALVFVGLMGYGDFRDVGQRIANFPISYLFVALGLAAVNYLLRFFRWVYYLKVLKIEIPLRTSFLIFLSGLALSLTPGKVGELVKCYLLRSRSGVSISASAPVVVMERVTDVVAVVLVGLSGLLLLPVSIRWVMVAILVLCASGTLLLASRHSQHLFQLPFIRRWKDNLMVSQDGVRLLTAPKSLGVAIVLGTTAWVSEGVAFWVILKALEAEVPALQALPIYAAATMIGAISTLPGGLVGTEGAMLALLQQAEVSRAVASTSTLIVRLVTLWFGVIIGLVALGWLQQSKSIHMPLPGRGRKVGGSANQLSVLPRKDQPAS